MRAVTALAALMLAAAPAALAQSADPIEAAIADPRRPAEDVARDTARASAEMLAFAEIGPGDRVADIRPEEGFFARLFAVAVGPEGRVYAFVPTRTAAREDAYADALAQTYGNVERITGALDAMTFPEPLDVIFTAQEYHDFHIPGFQTNVAEMNRRAFEALKPGGLYVVIDHEAAEGAGKDVVQTLHRIEGAWLRREVEAAGFVFEGESEAVRNPEDDHSLNVFDPAIRGRTDQFVYRFRKPN
ncbi:class I SAM-dependent methyltransferase [Brevundimonas balnearis]|uniref:Class I SAM-dependent methyltransferase n=1 Tax=Brevundimonas balnearis TaxID=1572858 RepID=A0ABV6R1Z5_9CAUL